MSKSFTDGKQTLWIDQHGGKIWASTVAELKLRAGGGRVFKVYRDMCNGDVKHVGYGVGPRWFTAFQPVERPV